jgi:hypothetical protein
MMKRMLTTCLMAACLLVSRADAQVPPTNAALRYWMAFAVMHDPPADQATAQLLDRVADGSAPWDEARLGKTLDDNREALGIMQRATTLAACDWGLEYELGPTTPIAHLAKARALGRLSVLLGIRLAARGESSQAIDAWLASVRFSQHVAQGGSLIALLSGRRVMTAALRALHATAAKTSLDAATRKRIETAVRALPETGFDWAAAMRQEEASIDVTVRAMTSAPDPKAYYARIAQVPAAPADFTVPSAAEVAAFHAFMSRIEAALALPFDQAKPKLAAAEGTRSALHPFFQRAVALVGKGFDDIEIPARRQALLDAVTK